MSISEDDREVRRVVQKTFSSRCIFLSKDSLSYLANHTKDMDASSRQKFLGRIIEVIEKDGGSSDVLDLAKLKEIVVRNVHGKLADKSVPFKLENACDWKRSMLDKKTKKWVESNHMEISTNYECLRQRFELIKQLLPEGEAHSFQAIESLFASNNMRVKILGMLSRGNSDRLAAEDLGGCAQLDMRDAIFEPGLYFEGGIYAIEGIYCSGEISVNGISLPNTRIEVEDQMSAVNKFGLIHASPNDRIVIMSDVHLDDARVMKAIYHILSGFASCPPNIFVICGNFLATQLAYGYMESAITAFRHLANVLSEFSASYKDTQFILVPSADDPLPSNVFPGFTLPPSIKECFKGAPNVHFASNPCRITFKGQTIVVCRDDIVEKLCRSSIHVPDNTKDIPQHFGDTIWSQRHISPLPLHFNAIIPRFDYLFHLWPLPDVLVIADKFKAFVKPDSNNCRLTINPGSFPLSNFEFQVYYPALRKVEPSSLEID